MTSVNFDQELEEIEKSFEIFLEQFNAGKESDFSFVYESISALLEASKKAPPGPQSLARLKALSLRLEEATMRAQDEMNSLQTELSQNNHRSRGLQAYVRHNKIGGT